MHRPWQQRLVTHDVHWHEGPDPANNHSVSLQVANVVGILVAVALAEACGYGRGRSILFGVDCPPRARPGRLQCRNAWAGLGLGARCRHRPVARQIVGRNWTMSKNMASQ